jgi:protein-S-isoprenylcysteine O-methyltransferase Ste14
MKSVLAHALLLVAPLVAIGRAAEIARPRAISCVAIMLVIGAVESSARRAPDPSRFGAPGTWLALASALALLFTTWAAIGFSSASASPWTWVGVPIALAGASLRRSAIRALGDAFTSETVLAPGRRVVTRGIYGRMRHPSEVGLLLIACGLTMVGSSVTALAISLLVLVPTVIARVASEDRLLGGS